MSFLILFIDGACSVVAQAKVQTLVGQRQEQSSFATEALWGVIHDNRIEYVSINGKMTSQRDTVFDQWSRIPPPTSGNYDCAQYIRKEPGQGFAISCKSRGISYWIVSHCE